ncbi:DDHD-domain-containing protein [Pseudovirgaria hyperparasitica]|uniref:DDHD-domain-containing protein n=1 Tax=Pseudovirgaria hyperparasitica TaxID=470096 RepID=A0A6A6VV48_9PEZI|nr:DDHD-domain-containing protein [Pseudovirgaria hyperparasitica]KAF2753594.1 DDHD-domain-containing protein [Pseudovirgaria hyperparasitica]
MSTPENKSYLSSGVATLSPWGSRSGTPILGQTKEDLEGDSNLGKQRGGDHTVSSRHRLSLQSYPRDTPPLNVQWYHAVDVPKRKPRFGSDASDAPEKLPLPKKWVPFSKGDSRSIEARYQKLAEEAETLERERLAGHTSPWQNSVSESTVPVNEDYLFDVNIDKRELAPAYWLGPVYSVVRGSWFYQEGTRQRPCDENLATQLEEGYLKLRPWRFTPERETRPLPQPRSRPTSLRADEDTGRALSQLNRHNLTPKSSNETLKPQPTPPSPDRRGVDKELGASDPSPMKAHRLFGAYMNSVVTYQDANTAWLLSDTFLSQVSSTVYQRFAGGGHFAGIKLTRGFVEKVQDTKTKKPSGTNASPSDSEVSDAEDANMSKDHQDSEDDTQPTSPSEMRRKTLERQLSSLANQADPAQQEEEVRRREEKEIRDDYKDEGDDQDRPIEHLLLITHGIGQRLGLRLESVNFVHDVNTLRKTMKAVYANSPDLQSLNSEVESLPKNSRVQVLPICWRHLLDFPKQSLKHNRKEFDLGEADSEEPEYPNLDDITIEGVPAVRNLITDLALDILLYQSPAYKAHISRIVLQECNRIHKLFKQRHPSFNGKVSLVGHSLGSAIMFDLLCKQEEDEQYPTKHQNRNHRHRKAREDVLKFDFDVDSFYALGSPIGLFQMLRGRTVAARQTSFRPAQTPGDPMDDPFMASSPAVESFDLVVSSPKCQAIYNIFHPTDPISYRIEPLISPAMSTLKPQPLPYTKRGIFGAPVGGGLSGIGQRVGASVSGFFSNFGTGIASSLLNRSLGYSGDDGKGAQSAKQLSRAPPSMAAANRGRSSSSALSTGDGSSQSNGETQRRLTLSTGEIGEHPATLIDSELETLYAGFQKRRKSQQEEDRELDEQSAEWAELEERSRKLRREEAKVRALNPNGRVDYSIQEGAFDISLIASIASHLSYWADEDVSHFTLSQLLSRQRVLKQKVEGNKDPRQSDKA